MARRHVRVSGLYQMELRLPLSGGERLLTALVDARCVVAEIGAGARDPIAVPTPFA